MKRAALTILGETAAAHRAYLLRAAHDHALFEMVPPTVSGKPTTAAYRVRTMPSATKPSRRAKASRSFCPAPVRSAT
jgi:hypothetical protein